LVRVEDVELELVRESLVEDLQPELELRVVSRLDRLPQVATVKIGVGSADLDGLVPEHRLGADGRAPVELDEARLAGLVDQLERVHAEAFHHAEGARERAVGHGPREHVHRLGHERYEVPERVVRGRGLREAAIGLHLDRVHQVRELHRVLDEEHGDVVADEVEVTLLGVELHGEAAHVARQIDGARAAGDGREAHEHARAQAGVAEELCACQLRERLVHLEVAVRARAARVHDAFRDALVIEVRDFFAQDEVFEQGRATGAGAQGVLVIRDRRPLVRGERGVSTSAHLVGLAAAAGVRRGLSGLGVFGIGLGSLRHVGASRGKKK